MSDMVSRLVWFFCAACLGSYAIFLLAGSTIHAHAVDQSRIVEVRDVLKPHMHALSGMVMVPKTCDQLTITTEEISPTTHKLVFTTWQLPSVPCKVEDVPRAFRAVVLAPAAGIEFIATLDEMPLTVVVYQEKARADQI